MFLQIVRAVIFQHCVAFDKFMAAPVKFADETPTMQARAQSQLLGQLLPMVAQLPSAQARCDALARIWAAAVASDLETRRAVRTRQKTLPGAELKQLLSDTFAMEVISGSSEGKSHQIIHLHEQPLLSACQDALALPEAAARYLCYWSHACFRRGLSMTPSCCQSV